MSSVEGVQSIAMSSLLRLAGELTIDHRASPGTRAVPEGKLLEVPTYTCGHCQVIVVMNAARQRAREVCLNCMAVVCDPCHGADICTPFIQIAEQSADAAYHAGSSGLLLPRSS